MKFKEFLFEIFDKPLKYERDYEMESAVRDHFHNPNGPYSNHKFGAIKAFKLEGEAGHLVHAVRNGSHELHHIGRSGTSGEKLEPSKPNARLVGTMMDYAKEHILGKNKDLKIQSHSNIHKTLGPLVERIATKNKYRVSHGIEDISGTKLPFTIVHKQHSSPLQEWYSEEFLQKENKNA